VLIAAAGAHRGPYKPNVPPMEEAKTTPSTTQQIMIIIFFYVTPKKKTPTWRPGSAGRREERREERYGSGGVPLALRTQASGRPTPPVPTTHPPRFALVLYGFFGVRHGPLHVVDRVLHVVLDAVDHLALRARTHP